MKILRTLCLLLPLLCFGATDRWKTIDEGFRFMLPWEWQKEKVRGLDSHVGRYRGKTAYMEFDEVFGLGYTNERARKLIDELKSKEANPRLLQKGEEVWRIDGRLARFTIGIADPAIHGDREFKHVASVFVPYEGRASYLRALVFFEGEKDAATVRRILASFEWNKSRTQG